MTLGSTPLLTEMSTGIIFWGGKGGWCIGLTNLLPSCADYLELWEPQPPWTLRACSNQTCTGIALPFTSGMLFCIVIPLFAKSRRQSKTDRSHPVVLYQYSSILVYKHNSFIIKLQLSVVSMATCFGHV